MRFHFPKDFVWGSATAAIQIEGAALEDGKGPSNWDDFVRLNPDKIFGRATPAVACDHYHRFKEDVQLMRATGHTGYRLSIAWTRIIPTGTGEVNAAGIKFYRDLFAELLSAGIEPNVTLYHWDLPLPLAEAGGWENKKTIEAFLNYACTCFELFGDQVKLWSTLNEPGWTTLQGYVTGLHPPNVSDHKRAVQVAHNFMVAHARAVKLFHDTNREGKIGIALNMSTIYSATTNPVDQRAASKADGILNRWFTDAVLLGRYPADTWDLYAQCRILPDHTEEELHALRADTVDFVGVNYYYPHFASADAQDSAYHLNTSGDKAEACAFAIKDVFKFVKNPNAQFTDWGWEIYPEGLYDLLARAEAYRPGIPIYITENGIGLNEILNAENTVEDDARIDFVREHLKIAHRAISAGINVRGYYMWALMDNFSWVNGYKKRYGFLYVDRETQNRFIKKSGHWYHSVSKNQGF